MKKIIAAVSAISLAAGMTVSAFAADYLGDVTKDGKVNSSDALAILEYSIGKITEIDSKFADMDKDGNINSSDALLVLSTSIGQLELQVIEEEKPEEPEEPEEPDEPQEEKLPETKEEIVEYYNNALKKAREGVVAVEMKKNVNIKVDAASGGKTVENLINNTILPMFAGENTEKQTFTDGKNSETTMDEFAVPAKLESSGAESAKIVKNGDVIEIEIKVVAEDAKLNSSPKYNTQCARPLDLGALNVPGLTVSKADFTYSGTVLKATVDSTGRVTKTSIYQPMNGSGEGKFLFSALSASISGSFEQECTYTY